MTCKFNFNSDCVNNPCSDCPLGPHETFTIWSDSYRAWSFEDKELEGIRTMWEVTPYQHYRLLEDGCIRDTGEWRWSNADLVQLNHQLDAYDRDREAREQLKKRDVKRVPVLQNIVDWTESVAEGGRDDEDWRKQRVITTVTSVLYAQGKGQGENDFRSFLNRLDTYIVSIDDYKGTLTVNYYSDTPAGHLKTLNYYLTQAWDDLHGESTFEYRLV